MFQQYEAELQEVLADAEARLGALLAAADTADRSGAVRQLNDLVRTARDLEKQIDVEVRSAAPDARAALRERARPLGDRLARCGARPRPWPRRRTASACSACGTR